MGFRTGPAQRRPRFRIFRPIMEQVPANKPVIGLMGAPGSGKSFVAELFGRLGCAVIDADAIAKAQLEDEAVKRQLAVWWGGAVLDPQGAVDRKAVGQIVFGDPQQKKRLEGLIHPRVHARRRELRFEHFQNPAVRAVVEDSPLLLESGIDRECDVLVYVEADRAVREARVRESRGWSAQELLRREAAQASLDTKRQQADYVIQNHAGPEQTFEQVRRVFDSILHAR